jgi:hypothetical protein
MGIIELCNALGIDKSVVSRMVKKGMPTTSPEAAQAWREQHAPPRAKRGQAGTPPPKPRPAPKVAPPLPRMPPSKVDLSPAESPREPRPQEPTNHDEPTEDDNTPRQSLRRARLAEKVGYNELVMTKRNGGSIEDIRKANQIYITSRNNRHKAERDFKEWQRDEGILLFSDEAMEIAGRPHIAAKQMLESFAKRLAPRLYGQSQKAIENTLAEEIDKVTEVIRKSI